MTRFPGLAADGQRTMNPESLANQWVTHRRKAGLITAGTARNQRTHLGYFVRAHEGPGALRIDRRSMRRWLESVGHLSPASRRSHFSTVLGFLRWAAAEGHVGAKVADLVPKVRQPRAVPRALNADQVRALLDDLADDRLRMICSLMVWCGLRCGEVATLRVEDVDERNGTLFVIGKGSNERVICIPAELAPLITRWLDEHGRVPGPFITGRWGSLQAGTMSTMVSRAMTDAGVKVRARDGRSAHALRHSCASDVLDRGASITTVAAMLGHSNIATTASYLRRARLEDLRAAMNGRTYGPTVEGAA